MSELSDALARLERAASTPEPAKRPRGPKAAVNVATSTPVRDADHRIQYVMVEMADGRIYKQTPVRDESHRIVEVVTEQVPRGAWGFYEQALAKGR